jgi:hypothetical protein
LYPDSQAHGSSGVAQFKGVTFTESSNRWQVAGGGLYSKPEEWKMAKAKKQPEAGDNSEWFRSSDETGNGFVSGNTFLLKRVEYSVIEIIPLYEAKS